MLKVGLPNKACIPQTRPEVSNGLCVSKSDLKATCGDKHFSKSNDCPQDNFCCFSSPGGAGESPAPSQVSCTPSTAPEFSNGTCVAIPNLKNLCGSMEIASSTQCTTAAQGGPMQLCCFKRPSVPKEFPALGRCNSQKSNKQTLFMTKYIPANKVRR